MVNCNVTKFMQVSKLISFQITKKFSWQMIKVSESNLKAKQDPF